MFGAIEGIALVGAVGYAVVLFASLLYSIYITQLKISDVTFTVESKQRIAGRRRGRWLVFATSGETFQVTDNLLFGLNESTDRYRRLKDGGTYVGSAIGSRLQPLSLYRNLRKFEEVTPAGLTAMAAVQQRLSVLPREDVGGSGLRHLLLRLWRRLPGTNRVPELRHQISYLETQLGQEINNAILAHRSTGAAESERDKLLQALDEHGCEMCRSHQTLRSWAANTKLHQVADEVGDCSAVGERQPLTSSVQERNAPQGRKEHPNE